MIVNNERLLAISVGGFAVMSGSILLMPLDMGILSGCLFWGGLLVGILFQRKLSGKMHSKPQKWGIFTFFTGRLGRIVDGSMILLAIGLAAAMALDGYSYICYALLAAMLFSFCLHCIVNGRTFAAVAAAGSGKTKVEVSGYKQEKRRKRAK